MISIQPGQVTPNIVALFDFSKPTMPRAFNVLEGLNRGQILVDDPIHPTWAVVRETVYGTLYFGGQVTAPLVDSLVKYFRPMGEVGIGCWPDDLLNEIIPPHPEYDGRTLYFTERAHVTPKLRQLPTGFRLLRRDRELLAESFDYGSTLAAFGNIENVLRHTLGVVILDQDILVCEAATGAPTHGWIEVGVTTAEPYRGQGCATLACARLIELCEAKGFHTWWDCAKQNIASTKLARKLGYRHEREYRYVSWSKSE